MPKAKKLPKGKPDVGVIAGDGTVKKLSEVLANWETDQSFDAELQLRSNSGWSKKKPQPVQPQLNPDSWDFFNSLGVYKVCYAFYLCIYKH